MIRFSIRRWAAWAPGIETPLDWDSWARGERVALAAGQPALAGLDPMLRRRAGALGRLALEPLLGCDAAGLPVVFCSRHGEAQRSVGLLRALALGEPLSPTEFSLSVHNAVGGLFSIAHGARQPVTAVAGGPASAAHGLIEACAQLDAATPEVALVVYDMPLPPPYDGFRDEPEQPFGWAWVIGLPAGEHHSLEWTTPAAGGAEPASECLGLALLRAFLRGDAASLDCDGRRWQWRRHARA